ncbi:MULTISPECIES: KTSC domain-containing protein [Rhizobium]|uniref:KTSC domain-containing protein n=1 Tax=Rhizobium TaxID=379 RepID=UPI000BE8C181|nr:MULTISPECIES: KTSC domain-containing protein [Rhizobium]MBY4589345.1 KTSC domain-containing protein [Rhizobium redzepovicii]MBY4613633.1 KTSC domain-containing protein [Rhizobium redzepovicii]MDF0658802.1 KTSC domain-containing protein [Rhizobium sp. BC49]PDS86020.1 hypothetical protein CO654_08705 [Rhizobium sp. L18]TBY49367.1 KTSC domain-containing protein [Rhizobium leguminosarum bv. viciae]
MEWAALKSKHVHAAYDADSRDLHVKFPGSPPMKHVDIPPHVYENLLETTDPYFYYNYYIAPSRVSQSSRHVSLSYALKLVLLLAVSSLLMVTSLDQGPNGVFEESELRSN